jgi:hypothetical protein
VSSGMMTVQGREPAATDEQCRARVSGSEKEKKKLSLLYHVSGEGLWQNALVVLSHGGYNI